MEKGGRNMALIEANVGIRPSRVVSNPTETTSGQSNRQQAGYPNLDGPDYATECIARMFTEGYGPAALNPERWATQRIQAYMNDSR